MIVAVHQLEGSAGRRWTLPVEDGPSLVDLFGDYEHELPATLEARPVTRPTGSACAAPGVRLPP